MSTFSNTGGSGGTSGLRIGLGLSEVVLDSPLAAFLAFPLASPSTSSDFGFLFFFSLGSPFAPDLIFILLPAVCVTDFFFGFDGSLPLETFGFRLTGGLVAFCLPDVARDGVGTSKVEESPTTALSSLRDDSSESLSRPKIATRSTAVGAPIGLVLITLGVDVFALTAFGVAGDFGTTTVFGAAGELPLITRLRTC